MTTSDLSIQEAINLLQRQIDGLAARTLVHIEVDKLILGTLTDMGACSRDDVMLALRNISQMPEFTGGARDLIHLMAEAFSEESKQSTSLTGRPQLQIVPKTDPESE